VGESALTEARSAEACRRAQASRPTRERSERAHRGVKRRGQPKPPYGPKVANRENTRFVVMAAGNVAGQAPNGTGIVLYAPCPGAPLL
jgi:hypothetical protein